MFKLVCLVLFSLICASDQYSLFSAGCGNSKSSSASDGQHPYSYTYDWFHRSKLNEVVGEPPRRKLMLYYSYVHPDGSSKRVNLGNRFHPIEVKSAPYVWWRAEEDKLYTLLMIDADGEEKKKYSIRHWLVINIKGNNLNTGDSISDYLGAGPPKGTGDHRYAFMIYEQTKKIKDTFPIASSRSLNGRDEFNVKKFAKKYDLGSPLVANYFVASYDKSVDKFYEGLEEEEEDHHDYN